jgi:hypothetical protein
MSDEPAIWQTLTEAMKKQQQCLSKATVTHTLWDEGDVEVPSAKRAKYNQPPSVRSSIHTHAMVKRPSTLDEETMNVVSKFNDYTAYEDCKVKESNSWSKGEREINVKVVCGKCRDKQYVLKGKINLNGMSSHLEWLVTPDGDGTGADLLKLFEVMAKSQGSNAVTLDDNSFLYLFRDGNRCEESNPMIRSTILLSLLTGSFTGYYQALGYHDEDYVAGGDEDIQAAANALLHLSVGGWREMPETDPEGRLRVYNQTMKFHELFKQLHDQASGAEGNAEDQSSAKGLLLEIVSGLYEHFSLPWSDIMPELIKEL